MARLTVHVARTALLVASSAACATVVMLVTMSLRSLLSGRPSRTRHLELLPLSVEYHGRPVSETYQPGFDADPPKCPDGGRGTNLVVVVHSAHVNEDRRAAIRRTWGSLAARTDAALVFLLGRSPDHELTRKVREESLAYGDVVVSRNLDTYDNLTLKSVAMTEWVSTRCPGTKFFLKVDDDVFLNAPLMLGFLAGPEASTANRTMFGRPLRRTRPFRSPGHKHHVSKEEYPGDVYLDYLLGACYVITGDLSADLHGAALQSDFFRVEDIFLTGLMAERVGARRRDTGLAYVDSFYLKAASGSEYGDVDPCAVRKSAVILASDDEMYEMWRGLFDMRAKC